MKQVVFEKDENMFPIFLRKNDGFKIVRLWRNPIWLALIIHNIFDLNPHCVMFFSQNIHLYGRESELQSNYFSFYEMLIWLCLSWQCQKHLFKKELVHLYWSKTNLGGFFTSDSTAAQQHHTLLPPRPSVARVK